MELELNEYFAVTRGVKLHKIQSLFSMFHSEDWKLPSNETTAEYDRSYADLIFQAIEICYPMVAAKIIVGEKGWLPENKVISLNLNEIEIMILTPKYIQTMVECDK